MAEGAPTIVVGTAGHIDHGKTSLVRALTGVDLDTLPEERERGITIALGFTALALPDRRIALIDVPGHERLVRTMVAGAHGLDAALLVVSADDGVMPQTREHLAILGLLGVAQGAIVLTKVDLVDADLLEMAVADVAEVVAGTFLAGAPVVPFSAVDGTGHEALRAVLGGFSPRAEARTGPFRLSVDRAFVRAGFGTVVTGTARGGVLQDGARVRIEPSGKVARVRGLELHGGAVPAASGGHRVAINLAGVDRDEVPRGSVVTPGNVAVSSILDVRYTHVADAPLEDDTSVRLLLGTAEHLGRAHLVGQVEVARGEEAWVQVRLEEPACCLPGDRLVLRRTTPVETLGGGWVADPWAPRLRAKEAERVDAELDRLAAGDLSVRLERAGDAGLTPDEASLRAPGVAGVLLGDRVLAPARVARLEALLSQALDAFHAATPLSPGPGRRELRRGRLAHLGERVFDGLVDRLAAEGRVVIRGATLRAPGFEVRLTPAQAARRQGLLDAVAAIGLEAVDLESLRERFPGPELDALVHLLGVEGAVVLVPKAGLVTTAALTRLRDQLVAHFSGQEALTPGEFKDLSGLTRKTAIPMLEALDRWGWTRRRGDARIEGPALREGPAVPTAG